jgi:RHS repeat-associated protein
MPGLKGKYDAWNRLVEVRDSNDNLIAQYEYNGLNQRIKKTVNGVVTKSFFNENWQELESQTGNEITSYVWGLRYIDDLICRIKGNEQLYSLADPNWNVIAICDPTGNIQERYTYDAFGKHNILDASFSPKMGTDFNWNRTFTGQVLDSETGLMLYRNRFYHVGLGRFVNRDPIDYRAEDINFYRYESNRTSNKVDPLGLMELPLPNPFPEIPWPPIHFPHIEIPKIRRPRLPSIPDFPMLPSNSPECDKYPCNYSYSFTNARCFCKCAGDSDWSRYVRGCLRHYYDQHTDPTKAHALCYFFATTKYKTMPAETLGYCVAQCNEIVSVPTFPELPTIHFDLPSPPIPNFPIPFDPPFPFSSFY